MEMDAWFFCDGTEVPMVINIIIILITTIVVIVTITIITIITATMTIAITLNTPHHHQSAHLYRLS